MSDEEDKDLIDDVYRICRTIPLGKVTTYAAIARAVGSNAYRAIGAILNKNPDLINTPCHRVINSNGDISGYVGGVSEKRKLLMSEGVEFSSAGKVKREFILESLQEGPPP